MKTSNKLLFLLLFVFQYGYSQTSKVLIIGIDGTRSDAMVVANTPNLDQLITNGVYAPHAYNADITISGPGWSAILCGVRSDKHLVTNNNFEGNNYEEYPTLFKYIEDFDEDLHTLSVCHWSPINDAIVLEDADFKINIGTDAGIADFVVDYVGVNDPDVIFTHFDDVDHAGHASGFSPDNPNYIDAIETTDIYVGQMLAALENRPNYEEEDWLILVTTDHGGMGNSHGGTNHENRNVFIIASGDNVPTSTIQRDSTIIYDNVVDCLGDDYELVFDGSGDYVQVADNPLFDFGADQDFTIECRIRTDQAADVAIVGNKDWDSGVNPGFVFSFRFASGPEWKVNIGDGSQRVDMNVGGSVADNEWHTLSVTFDRDGMMTMYEDGVYVDQADISNIGDITTSAGLFFGSDILGAYSYNGSIAEVRAWQGLLSAQTIEDYACSSLDVAHPNTNNLLGYWKMNEGLGAVEVVDYSVNNNPGQIVNASWDLPDSTIVYDYTNTGRLVDVPMTALTHLCIPINEEWDLDGTSLIAECMATSIANQSKSIDISVAPNPTEDELSIKIDPSFVGGNLTIHTACGITVWHQKIIGSQTNIDVSTFESGLYYLVFEKDGAKVTRKVVK